MFLSTHHCKLLLQQSNKQAFHTSMPSSHDSPTSCSCAQLAQAGTRNASPLNEAKLVEHIQSIFPEAPPQSTQIFYGGTIRTMQDGDASITVEALGFENGKIAVIGSLFDCVRSLPNAELVNLQGKCVLPGLIEPHVHVIPTAKYSLMVDVSPFNGQRLIGESYTLDYCMSKIKTSLADPQYNVGGWVTAFGLDPSLFVDSQNPKHWQDPDVNMLDELSDSVCILVVNSSSHVAYANTAALQAAGVADKYPDGILLELDQVIPVLEVALEAQGLTDLFSEKMLRAVSEQLQTAASRGATMVWDALLAFTSAPEQEFLLFDTLAKLRRTPVRLGGAFYISSANSLKTVSKLGMTPNTYTDAFFHVPSMKIITDGSNQGLTGFQKEEYGNPNDKISTTYPRGVWNFPKEDLSDLVTQLDAAGWSMMIHANGDKAMEKTIRAYAAAYDANQHDQRERRHRIEHCSLLDEKSLQDMVELKLSPSFLIGHVGYWGHTFVNKVWDLNKANKLDRAKSAVEHGLRVTLHSDRFVTPFGPLRMMEQAVTRIMEGDEKKRVLNENECLTIEQALRAATYDAAWQCHADEWCGSLVAGKSADMTILAEDPVTRLAGANNLRDVAVCETWVEGRLMHSGSTSVGR